MDTFYIRTNFESKEDLAKLCIEAHTAAIITQ